MSTWRAHLHLAGVVLTGVLFAACMASGDQEGTRDVEAAAFPPAPVDTTSDVVATTLAIETVPFPLARYALSTMDVSRTVYEAVEAVITDCMSDAGFDYGPRLYIDPATIIDAEFATGVYALDNLEDARNNGYGSGPPDAHIPEEVPTNPALEGLSEAAVEAWYRAFFGDGEMVQVDSSNAIATGGCLDEAESVVYGDRVGRYELLFAVQALILNSIVLAQTDEALVAAVESWSACMASRGFPATDLEAARELYATAEDSTAAAGAEVECNLEVGLNDMYSDSLSRIQNALAEENQVLLAEWDSQLRNDEARAVDVIASLNAG